MRLQDFFEKNRKVLSEENKLKIYNNFVLKKNKKYSYSRISFYLKVSVYTFILIFLINSLYLPIWNSTIDNEELQVTNVWTWFVTVSKIETNLNVVKADYIGDIIEAQWNIIIKKDWKEFETDVIYNWNTVLLENDAAIKFTVNSWSMASIEWPAEFSVFFIWKIEWVDNYVINLIYWKYLEIKKEEKSNDNIFIQTNDFLIEWWNNSEMNFTIESRWEEQIVENKWWDIMITKLINNKEIKSEVKKNEIAKIDDDEIKLIKEIEQKIKKWDISISYNMDSWKNINDSWEFEINTSKLLEYETKNILSKSDNLKIKNYLNANFLMKDIKNIVLFYLKWDKNSYNLSYRNLQTRLVKIWNILNLDNNLKKYKWYEIVKLRSFVEILLSKMNEGYYMPEKYLNRLEVLKTWLILLENIQFGKYRWESFDFDEVFVKLNIQSYTHSLTIN